MFNLLSSIPSFNPYRSQSNWFNLGALRVIKNLKSSEILEVAQSLCLNHQIQNIIYLIKEELLKYRTSSNNPREIYINFWSWFGTWFARERPRSTGFGGGERPRSTGFGGAGTEIDRSVLRLDEEPPRLEAAGEAAWLARKQGGLHGLRLSAPYLASHFLFPGALTLQFRFWVDPTTAHCSPAIASQLPRQFLFYSHSDNLLLCESDFGSASPLRASSPTLYKWVEEKLQSKGLLVHLK